MMHSKRVTGRPTNWSTTLGKSGTALQELPSAGGAGAVKRQSEATKK